MKIDPIKIVETINENSEKISPILGEPKKYSDLQIYVYKKNSYDSKKTKRKLKG